MKEARGRERETGGRLRVTLLLTIRIGLGVETLATAAVVTQERHSAFPAKHTPPRTRSESLRQSPALLFRPQLASGSRRYCFRNLPERSGCTGAEETGRGGQRRAVYHRFPAGLLEVSTVEVDPDSYGRDTLGRKRKTRRAALALCLPLPQFSSGAVCCAAGRVLRAAAVAWQRVREG